MEIISVALWIIIPVDQVRIMPGTTGILSDDLGSATSGYRS